MAGALDSCGRDVAEAARGAGSLSDAVRAWTPRLDGDLYVVLDQFDEYLLYHPSEEEDKFAQELPSSSANPA